jgi:hypothetical protein
MALETAGLKMIFSHYPASAVACFLIMFALGSFIVI